MIQIHKMTIQDLNQISNILNTEFDDFWNENLLKSEIENPNSKCIIAKSNDEIVGFACIWKAVDDIHITNIVVKKIYRKQGIGSLLLKELIKISNNENVTSITLEVKASNLPAQNLYQKYGFKVLGRRKKYYNGTEDAIIMTKDLKCE
ncbi:MAG: ribosomal protein S18-alanine N-acetyltransferase [Clostridia bacterium]|nr:ribosomal protein S18-alanine N-acetyltransferase [Clostridia bacterium]